MDDVPLSVVIAAHNASSVIESCLRALEPQAGLLPLEVIVADSSDDQTPEIVRTKFPWVILRHFDAPLSIPALRGRGIAVARGAIIAMLDPFSMAAADWASQVIHAHARLRHKAIGGSVDLYQPEAATYARWCVYLNEYGLFTSPVVRGGTWILPGSNLSYKREALFDGPTPRYPVFWKTNVNWELEGGGSVLWLEPDIRVEMNKPIGFADFLRTRYHHGRCFAGLRVQGSPPLVRVARACSAALIPLLLIGRWSAGFWPKRRLRWRFLATLPAQFALFAVWAWGEALGYLWGTGRSCEQIYY